MTGLTMLGFDCALHDEPIKEPSLMSNGNGNNSGPRVVQPAVFFTDRPEFTTSAQHPSERNLSENRMNRNVVTMQKVPETVTHSQTEAEEDAEFDIPEPSDSTEAQVDIDDLMP